jgi:peptide/nickel transport system substrate-binding protein
MSQAQFSAGLDGVVNPSRRPGGCLRFARTDDFDSIDPGNTYYAYTWNFIRLFGRSLVTFDTAAGRAGQRLVPDLAAALGVPSDGGRTWTYRLRPGLRFESGEPITARDVKYAVQRSNYAPDVLSSGPTYFRQYLGTDYPGPYRDRSPGRLGLAAIDTPDDRTLVFHLAQPFAGFDHLATLPSTVPVPPAADTGPDYTLAPVASGPYRVAEYRRGELLRLLPNPHWDPATDPVRRRLADEIVVELGVDPDRVDELVLAGAVHLDLAGFGVQPHTQAAILADPGLARNADNPLTGFTWMYCISRQVVPFDDLHCRRAVQYATDKAAMQAAYGGPLGGAIASTILPPTIDGYRPFDCYPSGPDQSGDLAAARTELAAAGRPDGFRTRIAARRDRRKEYRAAQALSAGLARVGIEAEVVPFGSGGYVSRYTGRLDYLREQRIGIVMFGWGADFPDGFGFLQQIVDGRAIKAAGNQNLGAEDNPRVNALLDEGARTADPVRRSRIWGEIDRLVMADATIAPYLYAKSLLYRDPAVTNAYVSGAYGMYDYAALGVAAPA